MKQIKGGICAPLGFAAAGIYSGVKKSGRKDLSLIFSEKPAILAAVFTTNQVKAAPILVSQENARAGLAQAIIANSGNANCATGKRGLRDAKTMVRETASALGIDPRLVLVTSTGSIGKPLEMSKIVPGIQTLAKTLSRQGGGAAADAILTTDTFRKEIALEVEVSGKKFRIAGIAKGSGMIHPNMATMHAFITTDAAISRLLFQQMLRAAVAETFNMVSVDREMSTNDCVFALANGVSGVKIGLTGEAVVKFAEAMRAVCIYLAKAIARDGEGATKLVEIKVKGARHPKEARAAARWIAGSDLVCAAFYGGDPNFGRIVAALGASGASFDPDKIAVKIQDVLLVRGGCGLPQNMGRAAKQLKAKEIKVEINLNAGRAEAVAWGCDLSYDYVKINAKYHT
jgi:glutamate N-acetyltransferase/amino-acid N-acetyltransferase